jgi:DNA-binding MarR family transcriptional regulator
MVIANNNGTMFQYEIAKGTQTELHNITTLIDRLKKGKLVTTQRDKEDKRKINVTMTDEGHKIFEQVMPVAQEIINNMMASIKVKDANKCNKMLEALRANARDGLDEITK